jgi:hypothetical protein
MVNPLQSQRLIQVHMKYTTESGLNDTPTCANTSKTNIFSPGSLSQPQLEGEKAAKRSECRRCPPVHRFPDRVKITRRRPVAMLASRSEGQC